jgi:1D-myo-inositol-tetrakisphosphate 5-kinase/inositol-polyphosphate multikinase
MSSDGVLSDESGALVIKPCTTREVKFYTSASEHPSFKKWMPTFLGTLELTDPAESVPKADGAPVALEAALPPPLPPTNDRKTSIVLQNLTHGFQKPCVLDVKLGAQLWDEDAKPEKRARLDAVSDVTTSRSLGMRVAGMRVWKGEKEGGYKAYDKQYGRTFTAENCVVAVKEYLGGVVTEEQRILLAKRFLEKVKEVQEMLEKEESRMFSASLLFVYEGDEKALELALGEEEKNKSKDRLEGTEETDEDGDGDGDDEAVKKAVELKLIDFAHASWTPGKGPDENALQGVRSMGKLLAELAG